MDYVIIRLEETTDRQGAPEVFVQVEYTHDVTGAKIPYAQWIIGEQATAYFADKSILPDIIASWEDEALRLYQESQLVINQLPAANP
jgi:hypothetical protein